MQGRTNWLAHKKRKAEPQSIRIKAIKKKGKWGSDLQHTNAELSGQGLGTRQGKPN